MRKLLASILVFLFAFFVFSATPALAKVVADQKGNVQIGKNEVVDDDLFIAAQTVEIDGVVNGDVFIGAQTVRVAGIINGSLHVGANILALSGSVKGNVYAGAQNVLLSNSTIVGSANGRQRGSGPWNLGSNPSPTAIRLISFAHGLRLY